MMNTKNKNIYLNMFYNKLNNKSFHSQDEKIELCNLFYEFCKNDMQLQDIKIDYNYNFAMKSVLADFVKNPRMIRISSEIMKKNNLAKQLILIAHELKHSTEKKELKVLDKSQYNGFPMNKFDNTMSCFGPFDTRTNLYFYECAFNEKNAQDFSVDITKKFFNRLVQIAEKNDDKKTIKICNKELKKIEKIQEEESLLYSNAILKAEPFYKNIKEITVNKINCVLNTQNLIQNNSTLFNKDNNSSLIQIDSLLNFYCDNDIKNIILNYGYCNSNINLVITCLNNVFVNVSKEDFEKLSLYIPHTSECYKNLSNTLSNWNMPEIKSYLFPEMNDINSKEEKYSNKTSLSYKNMLNDKNELAINNTQTKNDDIYLYK